MYLKIAHNLTKKKITFDHINHKKKKKKISTRDGAYKIKNSFL